MTAKSLSLPARFIRLARLALHALRAWWILHVVFPRTDAARHDAEIRVWSRKLLRVLGINLHIIDPPEYLPTQAVLVSNHVSWLDIFVIYAQTPGLFIAKSEVREWPLIGGLIGKVGTLFIERGSPRHARAINSQMRDAIVSGRLMCLFPEGTTTEGDELKPFKAALLQPAVEVGATVIPVALRYVQASGERNIAPNYAGDTTLMESLWRIVSHPDIQAELRFLSPVDIAPTEERRSLARRTEELIAEALALPTPRKGIDIGDDLPGESQ